MTTYPIIKNPHYVDAKKTIVGMTLVQENGIEAQAQFSVPKNREKGVNAFWDRILEEFDEQKMRDDRNAIEVKRKRDEEFMTKKRRAAIESEKLRILFDQKMKAFEYPFVKEATNEEKSAIRRSPDSITLSIVISMLAQKYINSKNFSVLDFVDDIDNSLEKKE